ncbi:Vac14p NDAI_0J02210 [Naumovozyma dairenensis CBS 421]|uniref:Vacuolar protein 14 C-terminal Fig4-binding domain-containing protein n=1 Tax=Naumovozyma dairenensis (strain ATCC 10597 / BCRC 20456 / CBS 421 / NBRC 0211 / NRRL Y-12639) TaxID=1071378 RepID=G0WH35_NAUDC|nr:hypothetical protein NDAI_0J02210 [Naumovozyma dairenensis CBS 421]CCD27113.1 hypothetical protein NDAI_0J02210 [Naumovozyma dairenensis CBS 421]
MDKSIIKGLNDKLYEKRKSTALELEELVKQCLIDGDYDRIDKIIGELCRDYAYALHQPMSRNAGLMGLAASAIALGVNDVGRYLRSILPPVLACFGDQNDQVRFYACESLYNIAKIAKGEILPYFNEIFDVLCKISADTENSVRGAAELLDRLIKDIVAERASSYISIVNNDPHDVPSAITADPLSGNVYQEQYEQNDALAFSLQKFIPLLSERIYAINPDTRVFLINWLNVLLNIPGLELITYLPSFLGGLFSFLGDSHKDVRTMTHSLMDVLLHEVQEISKLQIERRIKQQQEIEERNKMLEQKKETKKNDGTLIAEKKKSLLNAFEELSNDNISQIKTPNETPNFSQDEFSKHEIIQEQQQLQPLVHDGEEYIPGQDIQISFPEIISILVNNLASSETEVQLIAMHWIDVILDLSPDDFIPFLSHILSVLLKLLSDSDPDINQLAHNLNRQFLQLSGDYNPSQPGSQHEIPYGTIVNTLTLQFFDGKVEAKIAYLEWLQLIYRKVPGQIIDHNDSMFLTLLKSLSSNHATLIAKALDLLQSLCSNSNDDYLRKFLEDFLKLLKKDPKLLKNGANYIMRQICVKLSPESVYKTISSILNSYDDVIFVRMVIQILSNILITSPEMYYLRVKLRQGDDRPFFNTLFKSWCYNSVSIIALCLVSESYELAYSVLQIYANYEVKINDLVQLDMLVQLFESPIFTRMRLQLLEQQKYPYLYKCLYGILMILPQTKAFEILNRRLSSANIWASQPYSGPSSNMNIHSSRSISNSTAGLNSSSTSETSSQRIVSQNKLYYQELQEHFKTIIEQEQSAMHQNLMKESDWPLLGTYLDTPEERTFPSIVPSRNITADLGNAVAAEQSIEQPMDNSSIIYHPSDSAKGSLRTIASKFTPRNGEHQ